MTVRYQKIIETQLLHRYYSGDFRSTDLRIVPTRETASVLRNYGLLFRSTPNGWVILARIKPETTDSLLFPIFPDEGFHLTFALELANPEFLNFTDLSIEPLNVPYLGRVRNGYYLSNLVSNIFNEGTVLNKDLQLLSEPDASNAVSEKDRIVYLPRIFPLIVSPPSANFQWELRDRSNAVVASENIAASDPLSVHEVKLLEVPPDLYTFHTSLGSSITTYISDDIASGAPFGLMELFHNADVDPQYQFVIPGGGDIVNANPREYHILFNNRSTVWRYLFPRGVGPVNSITKPGSTVTFAKDAGNNRFDSDQPIPLIDTYQAVEISTASGVIAAPNPDTRKIKPDTTTNSIFSEMYIYL